MMNTINHFVMSKMTNVLFYIILNVGHFLLKHLLVLVSILNKI
jgi:hypothetical protein